MLQHLILEDELEARRRSDELLAIGLLVDVARAGVFGGLGDARRSRALGGGGGGSGGLCLLAGSHGGIGCLRMVSYVSGSAPATVLRAVDGVASQKAERMVKNLQRDVVGVVDEEEIRLMRALYVYYARPQDRASLPRQRLCQDPTTLLWILRPSYNLLL
jgi:hypothetical protein